MFETVKVSVHFQFISESVLFHALEPPKYLGPDEKSWRAASGPRQKK